MSARIASGRSGQAATTVTLSCPFVDFVEFVCVALPWQVRPYHLDQPGLDLIGQPVPQPHDEGKVRVLRGKGVGKSILMCRHPVASMGVMAT